MAVARNTAEPGTSLSAGTPGKSDAVSGRSATVTWRVSATNFWNCALVTGVVSIQKPWTVTRCDGNASGIPQFSHPIQKVPPGTQIMPSGAGPGGFAGFDPSGRGRAGLLGRPPSPAPGARQEQQEYYDRPDCEGHVIAYATAMTTIRYRWIAIALGLLAMVSPAESGQARPGAERRPNVLLIMADDLNDDMGTFGHPVVKTPNLDRLAKRGVRFNRAYNQFPLCSPSRVSLLTGLRPDTTRVHDLQTDFRTVLPNVVTLPQMFKSNGYFAARVGKIYHYGNPGQIGTSGLDDPASWDAVVNPRGIDKDEESRLTNFTPSRGLGSALAYYASPAPDAEHTDGKVAAETIALLEKQKDRPFFIGAGFYRPHCPFIAPQKYFDLYPLDTIRAPAGAPESRAPPAAWFTTPPHWGISERDQRETIRAYYASISFLDANVGRLLDALERLQLARQHHRGVSQRPWLSPRGQRPVDEADVVRAFRARAMIVAGAGVPSKGRPSSRIVEFLDLYPTLAELAGVRAPQGLHGRSLMPLLENPEATWDHPALTQVRRGLAASAYMGYSVRTEKWRYTEWDGGARGEELYDEVHDPAESNNLAADPAHRSVVAEMQRLLRRIAGH